jgi:NB-ARC domain
VLGLHGMGGIGKTTLAQELFSRLSSSSLRFSSRLFLTVGQDTPLLDKQCELIQMLTGSSAPDGASTAPAQQQLQQCTQHAGPLLLVLDDIWEAPQLDELLCLDALSDGSRVIITGRDRSDLQLSGGSCIMCPVEALADDAAERLLCQHAFAANQAPVGYAAAVQQALKVCGGLPLALQVVGAGMRSRKPDDAEVRPCMRLTWACACHCRSSVESGIIHMIEVRLLVLCRRMSGRCWRMPTSAAAAKTPRGSP